jgi:hypothetical protein
MGRSPIQRTTRGFLVILAATAALSSGCEINTGSPKNRDPNDLAHDAAGTVPNGGQVYWIGDEYPTPNPPGGTARRGDPNWWFGITQYYGTGDEQVLVRVMTFSDSSQFDAAGIYHGSTRRVSTIHEPSGEIVEVWLGSYPGSPSKDAALGREITAKLEAVAPAGG